MSAAFLEAIFRGEFDVAAFEIDLSISADWHDDSRRRSQQHFLGSIKANPDADRGPRAIGLRSTGGMIGHIGFHTA